MNRMFLKSTMDIDKKTPAYKIICNHCRRHDKVAAPGNVLPPDFIAKKFRQKGWIVSKKGNDDICPQCMMPAPTPTPPTKLLELSPTKPRTVSSFKELAKVMTSAPTPSATTNPVKTPPPPVVNKVEDKPKAPDVTGTNWKVVEPVKKSDEAELTASDLMHELPGEIRRARVVESLWATSYEIKLKVREGKLTVRRGPLRRSFLKIDEVIREFGEPRPFVADQLSRTKSLPVAALPAPAPKPDQTSNKEPVAMNFDPKLPPEMTKEDRRIIFADIDMRYIDESKGYDSGYDDKRIAEGLNVPLAWVRTIREENFGPEKGSKVNADAEVAVLKKAIEDAKKVLKDTEDMIEKNKQIMMSIDNAQRILMRQVENVNMAIVKVNVQITHLMRESR